MDIQLTKDQERLLVLISMFSRPARKKGDDETWIKKIPLMSLINRGIRMGIFRDYDSAPMIVEYMGQKRFANISKEGEDDIADLREIGLIERLKLATSYHVYVSAYRITPAGLEIVKKTSKIHKEKIGKLIGCKKCHGEMDIEARDDSPYLFCGKCGFHEPVRIFDLEELSYVSKPVFSLIWNPPD